MTGISPTKPTGTPAPASDSDHPFRYTGAVANNIEPQWQHKWAEKQTFKALNPGDAGFDSTKPKFYCLDMFPYPSGAGLHVGHPVGYIATDILSRFKRMRGFNVLHPMGWDAFGLPAEQYAVQTNVHPAITTRKAIDTFRAQLQRFGMCYDWSREFATIDPEYHRWTQWIWLQAYNAWYDPRVNAARPISELERELESGRISIDISEELVFEGPSLDAIFGSPVGQRKWHEFSSEERREIIDSYRLAYLAEQVVNWCPKLGTVLANEEVIDGRSERGGYPVQRMPLKQWMFRITAYAERLLADLALVKWPESTRIQQTEWIGRSEGAEIDFSIEANSVLGISEGGSLRVFTTRPDTIFGATYMVIAPEHPLVDELLNTGVAPSDLRLYVAAARNRADVDRMADTKEKSGIFTGLYAVNPAVDAHDPEWPDQQRIPIWVADYVLMGYGHGAIMAVPSHDQRDFEFARKYDILTHNVVMPPDEWFASRGVPNTSIEERRDTYRLTNAYSGNDAYPGEGVAMNSENSGVSLNGLPTAEAKARIINWLEHEKIGSRKVNYKLRDWLFSRQRYWGEPFPVVFDEKGNHYPIQESHLPVRLPELADFKPIESSTPTPPLGKATDWVRTTAAEAGVSPGHLPGHTPVTRETNTMPNWAGSCWYYLRYCDPKNAQRFVGREAEQYWMVSRKSDGTPHAGGVDLYVGGSEHAVLHLLYARFWHKVLFDLGEVSTPEPFGKLFHQGLISSFAYQRSDKTLVPVDEVVEGAEGRFVEKATGQPVTQINAKMSKSLKNVINPDDVISEFGADTFRLYEMYMGPLDAGKPWNPRDIAGLFRFLQRLWRLAIDEQTGEMKFAAAADPQIEKLLHRTIHKVSADIERLAFNTAIAAMIEFVNTAASTGLTREQLNRFIPILTPFAPHIGEELWSRLGNTSFASLAPWPAVDPSLLKDDTIELPVQLMGKVKTRIMVPADADAKSIESLAMADEKVKAMLKGKTVKKIVVVPGRMVNIVAGDS